MSMMYARNLVDLHLKYYTDSHNVDEDLTTITRLGGHWNHSGPAGIALRSLDNSPTVSFDTVASNAKI